MSGGSLAPGTPADITVLAPDQAVVVDPTTWRSLSRNTPFSGLRLKGTVLATIVGGRTKYVNNAVPGAAALNV